ncbi:MAG: hypothetical protein A3D96_04030 [Chlamydiae bacterium RIFCSPHIGHO2_12_FULL_44_59]|nr:MAG: hypothetical protein A2796_04475 [Chlamydiae bacterium RIFCSPHIGHO2_01_FULL_44_39]OGN58766.1 MAG: hypothetical protein A3C42_00255 [Chlamydiae bacterium RIFCSPHIGHO2_02_FULL_45_9]OGN60015.1 MAG: hypothetical protein A3D96_04030 [Chlamydiae bacterium RIFCSPHIGHO2_12_FULL_44_59]OGN68264.1 MAG: hypothetical protein A3I67_01035 [Chlamydiae bacterium RIFCSPLOWO2_02_FULL_45_22]OGN70063.1 MAG: hypothetical protein A3F79_05940 [Chlamydiae bacterium RIFCSPLOWO2_12_FULL_45_20]
MGSLSHRDFYFVRHGQTDHNSGKIEGEHLDISLNKTGRGQAVAIEPLIATLPLRFACLSPLRRAKETTDILLRNLPLKRLEVAEFSECALTTWNQMRKGDLSDPVAQFLQTVAIGLKQVLVEKGPSLIVAHGGIYFAICKTLGIPGDGIINNCVPVWFHFNEKKDLWQMRDCI